MSHKGRSFRIIILKMLSFIPDIVMVKLQYLIKTHRFLNLNNRRRFSEKLNYYKLFYRDPNMKLCVDKYEVRSFVSEQGYSSILNECFGVFDRSEDVDFNQLPEQFVIKDTLGGGGNSVIIVRDKQMLDISATIKQMDSWIHESTRTKNPGREWVYEGRKHRIIIEKYIDSANREGGLIDYKFFCNYGKIVFMYIIKNRHLGERSQFGIFTPDLVQYPFSRTDELPFSGLIKEPKNFRAMKTIAENLSNSFPEVRVDLYNVNGTILFGEMTFFDGSGYIAFDPDDADETLGALFSFKMNDKWKRYSK